MNNQALALKPIRINADTGLSKTFAEFNIMVDQAKYYNKVLQVGQNQRGNYTFIESIKLIRGGSIGNLRKVNI